MIPGPVAHFELVRLSRRRQGYILRFLFGLALLGAVWFEYQSLPIRSGIDRADGQLTVGELAGFGRRLFGWVIAAQVVMVLVLTPAIAADAIATERRAKTFQDLLTTRLSGFEIVAGKVLSRLLAVAVFLGLALPIVSLIALFGGISFSSLWLSDLALLSTAYFLASLSILVSLHTRRPREGVGAAYALTALWIFLPTLIGMGLLWLPDAWTDLRATVRRVVEVVWPTGPLELLTGFGGALVGSPDRLWWATAWMVGSQLFYGTLLAGLAAWRLRSVVRAHEGRAGVLSKSTRLARRVFTPPECGDDPIYWKDGPFARSTVGILRRISRLGLPALLFMAVIYAGYESVDAFQELRQYGYGFHGEGQYQQRDSFNMGLRVGTSAIFAIWLLWLGSVTSGVISGEREQDTWLGLLATPLEGPEILRGKMLAPLRDSAPFGVAILAIWLIGLGVGALHPLGFLNALVVGAILVWFVVSMAVYRSLHATTTWRARIWTQGVLLAPHLCCMVPLPAAAYLFGISQWSYSNLANAGQEIASMLRSSGYYGWMGILYYVGGIILYAGAAYWFTRAAVGGFDRVAGRPLRGGDRPTRPPWLDEVGEVKLKPIP